MIKIRKIIYWHFAVYGGSANTIDPENLPNNAISTLDMDLNETNPIIVNAAPNVRAFSASTGNEWLINIFVENGQTKDIDGEGKRTTIRSNNPVAAPGFVWFDLAVVELKAVFGNPIVVESLEQLSLVGDDSNDGVRIPVKYMLFGAHKEGETGAQLRNEPDAFFDATSIPNEVSSEGDQSHQSLVDAMSSKTFVDEEGVPNSFFINIKYNEAITKIGCCNIDITESSSSSSSGESSSSSSGAGSSSSSSGGSAASCSSGPTLRTQPTLHDDSKRVWAVRQTADIHISNNPVYEGNFFAESGNLVRKNYIASELVYADVENVLNDQSDWKDTHWQHAGYISFRENKPYAMGLHQDPVFNKTRLTYSSGNLCAYHAYDDNFELPVTIQSITWDTRGYLWALCSGGAKDSTDNTSLNISGIESTEGIYAIVPGGWKKYPADVIYFGGSNTGTQIEYEDLNSSALINSTLSMSWGHDRLKRKEFLVLLDSDFHIHIKKEQNSNINFPEEQNIRNDNDILLTAQSIYAGIEKICVIEGGTTLPYLISYNSLDTDLQNAISSERSDNVRYSILSCGLDFIVGVSQSGQIKVFTNSAATNVPTQDDADELQALINSDITNGYIIKKIACGDSFFVVYLTKTNGESKIYARGYIGDVKIWNGSAYDSRFLRPQAWDLSSTKPILDVDAFGDYLIIAYAEGLASSAPKAIYYEISTVLKEVSIHSSYTSEDNSVINTIDYELLNQLRKLYLDNSGNNFDNYLSSSANSYLVPSKGLLGYRKNETSNTAYGKLFIHENSEYLHHPYFGQTPGSSIYNRMQIKSGMFGYDMSSFAWDGATYFAVSSPTEGPINSAFNGGELGVPSSSHGRGAVYIFRRYQNGFKLVQKIQHPDGNVIAFGKQVCLYRGNYDATNLYKMSLMCSYRGSTEDYVRLYEWNPDRELFEWTGLDDYISTEGSSISTSSRRKIVEIKRIEDDILAMTVLGYNFSEGYAYLLNMRDVVTDLKSCRGVEISLTPFRNINFGPKFGFTAIKETGALGGWTVAVGYTTYNSALENSIRCQFPNIVHQNVLEIKMQEPVSNLIGQGNGAVILLYVNGNVENFVSNINGPIYKIVEGSGFNSNAATKPYFGYDIDADQNHMVISSPYDSGYSAIGETSNILEGGSVRIFELNDSNTLGDRNINSSSEYVFNLRKLSEYHLPKEVYNLSGGNYSSQWLKKRLGKTIKLVGNKILVSSCDDDMTIGPSQQSNSHGNVFLLNKNSKGSWDVVSCFYDCHKKDRFGHKIDILQNSLYSVGEDFIAFVSAPGMVTSAVRQEDCIDCPIPNNSDVIWGSGMVKSIAISGNKALGILPSRIPSVIQAMDSDSATPYTISRTALGIKHVAHDISNSPANARYTWKYYPARLMERSVIQSSVLESQVPKFKLAKFIADPVFGASQTDFDSTYSDIGAFSMISDTSGGVASDVTVANLPIYDRENLSIRVMEMHPRPYRNLDVSMNFPIEEESTSENFPLQVRPDYYDFATPATNALQETIYLYGPVIAPVSGTQWVGNISGSNSFAITPVRSSRWLIPISKSDSSYLLYFNGMAVWNPSSNVEYTLAGGYYFNSSIFIRPSGQQVHTNLIGNPLVKPFNGTLSSSRWWSTRNYISPGCVQLVDSSTEGHMTVWPNFNISSSSSTSGGQRNWGNPITGFNNNQNFYFGKSNLENELSSIDACKIDKAYLWGLKIADGSYNLFINAYLNNTSITPYRMHQTSKYMTWSGCTVALERNIESPDNGYANVYTGYVPSYESYDFNLGHILSYPPINFRCTTGNSTPSVISPGSTIAAITNAPNGSTHSLYLDAWGWNSYLMNVGVKDIVIHGHRNYHGFRKSNKTGDTNPIASLADRTSQIVTFISGYGSKISSIDGRNTGASYFSPSIKFTCILDPRISSYRQWKNNFGGLTDWNINTTTPHTAFGKIAKNPTPFANSFVNDPGWVSSSVPNGFNARVAPTDTMYMVDLFWDYDPDASVPSPAEIKEAIYNSSFLDLVDIYSNALLGKKVSGSVSKAERDLFPLRSYPLNRVQTYFDDCFYCQDVIYRAEGNPGRIASFGYSSEDTSLQCNNFRPFKFDDDYTNIVVCKTFTEGFGVNVGSVTYPLATHLTAAISGNSYYCSSSSSSSVDSWIYRYSTILYPSITSIDSHKISSASKSSITFPTGGGPSFLQWHSHRAEDYLTSLNGPNPFGFAPFYGSPVSDSIISPNTDNHWSRYPTLVYSQFTPALNSLFGAVSALTYPTVKREAAFKYPYKTNMLTGRGRNVQISALGSELRSSGRDEIIYQNEFIYRKLSYHRQNTQGLVSDSVNAQFSPTHEFDNTNIQSSGSYNNNHPGFANDVTNIVSVTYLNRNQLESDALKPHIREEHQSSVVSDRAYRRASLFDRVAPKDFFTNQETLVCIPTFSMPDMLDFYTTGNSYSHIFGILNNFSDTYSPGYPDSVGLKYVGMLMSSLTQQEKQHLGFGGTSASAFWRAIKAGLAHIVDVNSSMISLSTGENLLTVTILASLNGNTWSGTGEKHSFGWKNSVATEEIYGCGLICAVMTARVDVLTGAIYSVRSTFANSEATLGSSNAKIRTSATSTGINVPEKSWCRMGIWMQPLLGVRKAGKENSPYYWPGNFPWSGSSDIKYLGTNPGDKSVSNTNFFHTSPGMIKTPINRSYMIKLGKHIMLRNNSGSGADTYFAVIGPCVYFIRDITLLNNGPLWWANENVSTCFKMPSYSWDSRPVVFQKFGLSIGEMVSASSYSDLFRFAAYTGEVPRIVKSFFDAQGFMADFTANSSEFAAYGSISTSLATNFPPNEQWFDYNSTVHGFNVDPNSANDSVAILGEGIGFNVYEGSKIHSFIFWRNSFYRITPPAASAIEKRPVITQIPINATYVQNGQTISIKNLMQSAYELHRLNGFFNGTDRFVVAGNSGNDTDGAFVYVFKFKSSGVLATDGFSGPGMVYETRISSINNPGSVTTINMLCNQSFKYQVWMSNDASIIAIGNHRWNAQSDQISPNGEPLPSTFYVDLFKRNTTSSGISYTKLLEQGLQASNTSPGRPVDVFCSSIWGVPSSTNASLYDIYVASGIDPDSESEDYLQNNTTNYNSANFESRIGRVTVFSASVPSGGQSVRSIELNDIVQATDPSFTQNNKAFANLNFWTMTPVSAKNGSCGLMFHQNTLIASSLGCLIKMSPKSPYHGSGWQINNIVNGNNPMPSVSVKRVISPYSQFGYIGNNESSGFVYANSSDILSMSTISVPTINASASPGFNKLASKIAFVSLNVSGNRYEKIFSISNYASLVSGSSADIDQIGIFDPNENLTSAICYPAYKALKAKRSGYTTGQTNPETQIYNPSIKSWLYAYDLGNSLGDSVLPYAGYEYEKDTEGHILVKPPVPDIVKKQFYFGGNELLPLDGSNVYRDYHDLIEEVKGTLLQMDWQDVSGILWWGTNDIYVLRSYKHTQHHSPSAADILLANYINDKTYFIDQNNGITSVNKNAMVKFAMPNNSSNLVPGPTCEVNDYMGTTGCGLTGPRVITVAATSNYGMYDMIHSSLTSIMPLIQSREKFGEQRTVIVVDDFSDHMGDQVFVNPSINYLNVMPFYSHSSTFSVNQYRVYAEDMFIDNSMKLVYEKSTLLSTISKHQSGMSTPALSINNCEGPISFARKSVYSSSNTKWNYMIKDLSACFDPSYGAIYNGDSILLTRLSYIYENSVSASHPEAEWYFAPVFETISNTDVPNYRPSMKKCLCVAGMRSASRKVAKWKMNYSSGSNSLTLLDIITTQSGDQSPAKIRQKIDTSSNGSLTIKDLVLCGKINTDIINATLSRTGSQDIPDLMNKIRDNLYSVISGQSFMNSGGCIHIVDTDSEAKMDLVKEEFIKEFMNKFNGFYHIIRGA